MTDLNVGCDDIAPFTIRVPDSDLADLRGRLAKARWAPEPAGGGERYGVSRVWMQEFVEYWTHTYDWRRREERLNRYAQYTTTIDGTNVHFLHVRSTEPHALPLILSHDWPGSVVEFLDVIGPLSEPGRHGLVLHCSPSGGTRETRMRSPPAGRVGILRRTSIRRASDVQSAPSSSAPATVRLVCISSL